MNWVKATAITAVRHTPQIQSSIPLDNSAKAPGSMVTIGESGWAITVMDEPGDIIAAIAAPDWK